MSTASFKIKLSSRLRPFVSRIIRNGAVQRAFAANIGIPVGSCVAGKVHKGMPIGEIHQAVRDCSKVKKGSHFTPAAYKR